MNCLCDDELAFTLAEKFASGLFNDQFVTLNDGSGFDHDAKCHAAFATTTTTTYPVNENQTNSGNGGNGGNNEGGNGGPAVEELQCCGTYPNRFEFLTHGGSRSCCGEVTYDTNKHDCCSGGFIGAIGSCAAQ